MIEKQYDKVDLKIFDTRAEMGRVAAEEAASCLRELLEKEPEINCIFAAAPSQSEFLEGCGYRRRYLGVHRHECVRNGCMINSSLARG